MTTIHVNEDTIAWGHATFEFYCADQPSEALTTRERRPSNGRSCLPGAAIAIIERGATSKTSVVEQLSCLVEYPPEVIAHTLQQLTGEDPNRHLFREEQGCLNLHGAQRCESLPTMKINVSALTAYLREQKLLSSSTMITA